MADLPLHLAGLFVVRDTNAFIYFSLIHSSYILRGSSVGQVLFWALAVQSELAEETPVLVEFPF